MKKKKRSILMAVLIPLLGLALAFAALEAAMVYDTRELMAYAHKVFNQEVELDYSNPEDRQWYSYGNISYVPETATYTYVLRQGFTWHNFHSGFIYISYTKDFYDSEGERIPINAHNAGKWYIEKVNGHWKKVGGDFPA